MNVMGLLLSFALIVAGSCEAAAQDRPGTDTEAQQYLAEFADCVVSEKAFRGKVEAFLRIVPDSDGFAPAALRAADLHCLDTAARRIHSKITMRLQPILFRNALYPALYKRDFGRTGPVAGVSTVPPLQLSAEFDGALSGLPAEYRPFRAIGDCVARATPTGAHALLTATPLDAKEDAAIGELKPALAACLVAGQTLRMNRTAIRATIGEAMYKLSRAAASDRTRG